MACSIRLLSSYYARNLLQAFWLTEMYKRSGFPSSGGFRTGGLRRYCLMRSNESWHSGPHSNFTSFLNKWLKGSHLMAKFEMIASNRLNATLKASQFFQIGGRRHINDRLCLGRIHLLCPSCWSYSQVVCLTLLWRHIFADWVSTCKE